MKLPEPRSPLTGPTASTLHRPLPCSARSPLLARGILREALHRCPEETVAAAQLMASELVTNALTYARTPVDLEVEICTPVVRVTVEDASSELPRHRPGETDVGLGLTIVDSLSSAWGWYRTPRGKRVWFELRTDEVPTARPAWPD